MNTKLSNLFTEEKAKLNVCCLWWCNSCVQRINGNCLFCQIMSFTFLCFSVDHEHDCGAWSEILIAFLCQTDSKMPKGFIWSGMINKAEWKLTNRMGIILFICEFQLKFVLFWNRMNQMKIHLITKKNTVIWLSSWSLFLAEYWSWIFPNFLWMKLIECSLVLTIFRWSK